MAAPLRSTAADWSEPSLDGSERVLLDRLFESAPEAIVLADTQSRVIRTNAEFSRLFGYSAAEARGRSLDDLLAPPDLHAEAVNATAQVARGGQVAFETQRRRKDGSLVHVSVLGTPIHISGTQVAVFGIYRDIGTLKQMVEALQASEAQFASAFRSTPGPATISAVADGRLVEVNDAFVAVMGYSAEDAVGHTTRALGLWVDDRDRDRMLKHLAEAGQVRDFQYRFRTRAGEIRHGIFSADVIDFHDERCLLAITHDITERVRAEKERRERGRFLTLLNDITRAALETHDLQNMLQTLADRLGELFGADGCYLTLWDEVSQATVPAAAYGQWRENYRSLRPKAGEVTITESVLAAGRPLVVEDVNDTPYLSPRIAELFPDRSLLALPLIAGDQKLGAALVAFNEPHRFTPEDVVHGEQVAAQIALALAKAQLVEVLQKHVAELQARNEELDAFAHTVAHDLKSPLSYMVGFAAVLEQDYTILPPQEVRRHLHTIARSGRKMSNIVDELLLLAEVRKMEVDLHPLDMVAIVAEAVGRLAHLIEERRAEIILPSEGVGPSALGYGPWVEEVWINYLSNAIHYGGQPPRVQLGADQLQDRPLVRFWVRDNGPGLTPEEQGRLFTPFTRLEQVRTKGHGLGLSIVRRIVEKMGGEVGVESQVGAGSTFWFTLPAQ